jgi:hypothetical protein
MLSGPRDVAASAQRRLNGLGSIANSGVAPLQDHAMLLVSQALASAVSSPRGWLHARTSSHLQAGGLTPERSEVLAYSASRDDGMEVSTCAMASN